MGMVLGAVSKQYQIRSNNFKEQDKKPEPCLRCWMLENLEFLVLPELLPNADLNNHKEIPPTGGSHKYIFYRKEINADEIYSPTGKGIAAMVVVTIPKKQKHPYNNYAGSDP